MTSTRHGLLGLTVRTGAVALALAGMLLGGTAAWAGEDVRAETGASPTTRAAQQEPGAQAPEDGQQTDDGSTREAAITATAAPRAGRPGTKVWIEADGRQCDTTKPIEARFLDRRHWQRGGTGRPVTVEHASATGWFGASYTISSDDAVGTGRFVVTCTAADGGQLVDSVTFRVRPAVGPTGTAEPTGDDTGSDMGSVPVPSRIDTGQGGTADSGSGSALLWLLSGAAVVAGLGAAWLLTIGGSRR